VKESGGSLFVFGEFILKKLVRLENLFGKNSYIERKLLIQSLQCYPRKGSTGKCKWIVNIREL
jgi:hypothetical protein